MTIPTFDDLRDLTTRKSRLFILRILIVDPEYFVAMEAERILTLALECEIKIAMPRDFLAVLKMENFDVVLVHTGLVRNAEAMENLRNARTGVVLATLLNEEASGLAGWPGVPVVQKPFDEQSLIEAIKNAAQG